jgi:hypothetical protein
VDTPRRRRVVSTYTVAAPHTTPVTAHRRAGLSSHAGHSRTTACRRSSTTWRRAWATTHVARARRGASAPSWLATALVCLRNRKGGREGWKRGRGEGAWWSHAHATAPTIHTLKTCFKLSPTLTQKYEKANATVWLQARTSRAKQCAATQLPCTLAWASWYAVTTVVSLISLFSLPWLRDTVS